MSTQNKALLHWFARIFAIAYILFLSIFALDVIQPGYSLWEILLGLFMHLIPSFILIAALVIAWRWPLVGGGLFLILAGLGMMYFHSYQRLDSFVMISLPCVIIGILFIADSNVKQHTLTESGHPA